jgi:PAS domain-containing protein
MERTIKSLVLIRAKHLAESVTTPMLLTDATGCLVFYNEAAEGLLGRPFSDVGQMDANEWQERFNIRNRDDEPFPVQAMPGWLELQNERPTQGHLKFTTLDGSEKFFAVNAFPLFTSQRTFDGALVIFWEEELT